MDADREALERLDAQMPDMERRLAEVEATVPEREDAERARAEATPISLHLTVAGCEFASERYDDEHTAPRYSFDTTPCIRDYPQPCVECRTCPHYRPRPYGAHQPAHERRYPAHGLTIPLSEEDAEWLANALVERGLAPLRRPAHEAHALRRDVATLKARRDEVAERARREGNAPFRG